jgi:hypothetical protein
MIFAAGKSLFYLGAKVFYGRRCGRLRPERTAINTKTAISRKRSRHRLGRRLAAVTQTAQLTEIYNSRPEPPRTGQTTRPFEAILVSSQIDFNDPRHVRTALTAHIPYHIDASMLSAHPPSNANL